MSVENQRPTDPMTAADALLLREEVKNLIREEIRPISNRLSNMQRSLIEVFGILEALSASLTETRVRRLEEELFEVDQEREILEKRLNIVQAKKEMKQSDTPVLVDTNERIKKAAEATYAEREKLEEEARAIVWTKRKDAVITAIMVTTSVGAVGALLTAIGWFILFYLNNR